MELKKVCPDCGCVIEGDGVELNGEYYCEDCAADYVRCANCGEYVREDDATYCNGEYYCDACVDDCLAWCEHCGEYHPADEVEEVRTGYRRGNTEYWCEYCRERDAYQCENCGGWFSDGCDGSINHNVVVCPDCAEDYYYCENCDCYVYYDDYDSEAGMCCSCAAENGGGLIRQYHNNPPIEYIGQCRKQWRGVWRGIGVELEIDRDSEDREEERSTVERLTSIAGDAIYFERDGSLENGFEIITQPHTEEAFYAMPWAEILEACREGGYSSHDAGTCGLHLHISREMFGTNEERQGVAISKLIRFYDLYFADVLKISRRTAEQANRWAASYNTDNRKQAEHYGKTKNNAGRYYAINNTNRRTLEIRLTRGTLNLNSFMACIDFMLTVAKNSRRIAWKNVADAGQWLRGLKPATVEYIKNKQAFEGVI